MNSNFVKSPTNVFRRSGAVWVGLALGARTLLAGVPLPNINTNNVLTITSPPYNAVGDGVTTNTAAIQNAINTASAGGATNGSSGGTVRIPAGVFLSGPFSLKSSVNLQLDSGAVLRMLPFGNYPLTYFTNVSGGVTSVTWKAANFISGSGLHDIAIRGPGAIDGQGPPWWPYANSNGDTRPIMIRLSGCNRELIENVTLSNSPMFHISISGAAANTTVQGVTIRANPSSDPVNPGHNTDACDVSGTNILVQNCDISVGDDNFTCGGNTSNVLISNNTYGYGHGVSIGSYTSPSVSNLTAVNCSFNNTDQGIRIKSDRDRGGFVHNISYYNLSMTNVMRPILIYCQYTNTTPAYRALDNISPGVAASYPVAAVTSKTPTYRDITISNVTATAQSGRAAGLLWGLPEMCLSNITLIRVRLTGSKTFGIYNARNVRLIDCSHSVPAGVSQFSFYNAQVVFSNSAAPAGLVTFDGATTNNVANSFAFYNAQAALKNTNALGPDSSVTLDAATLTVSNNLALSPSNTLNFTLGTNTATIVVLGNLAAGGTVNIAAGGGFTNGAYTLFTYTGNLSGGLPTLGTAPADYSCAFDTNTTGRLKLVVSPFPPGIPTNLSAEGTNLLINLKWSAPSNATSYNLKRSTTSGGPYSPLAALTATDYSDAAVAPGTSYFYVVTASNAAAESADSAEAGAVPLPSTVPAGLSCKTSGSQIEMSWPRDHLGWRLQIQTNSLSRGLGTNWSDVPGANLTNQLSLSTISTNGSVFLRLVYP